MCCPLCFRGTKDSPGLDICVECNEKATVWCQEDECGFCEIHAKKAHKFAKAKFHTLVHPSKKTVKYYCKEHKKEMEKYCKDCDKVICMGMYCNEI